MIDSQIPIPNRKGPLKVFLIILGIVLIPFLGYQILFPFKVVDATIGLGAWNPTGDKFVYPVTIAKYAHGYIPFLTCGDGCIPDKKKTTYNLYLYDAENNTNTLLLTKESSSEYIYTHPSIVVLGWINDKEILLSKNYLNTDYSLLNIDSLEEKPRPDLAQKFDMPMRKILPANYFDVTGLRNKIWGNPQLAPTPEGFIVCYTNRIDRADQIDANFNLIRTLEDSDFCSLLDIGFRNSAGYDRIGDIPAPMPSAQGTRLMIEGSVPQDADRLIFVDAKPEYKTATGFYYDLPRELIEKTFIHVPKNIDKAQWEENLKRTNPKLIRTAGIIAEAPDSTSFFFYINKVRIPKNPILISP